MQLHLELGLALWWCKVDGQQVNSGEGHQPNLRLSQGKWTRQVDNIFQAPWEVSRRGARCTVSVSEKTLADERNLSFFFFFLIIVRFIWHVHLKIVRKQRVCGVFKMRKSLYVYTIARLFCSGFFFLSLLSLESLHTTKESRGGCIRRTDEGVA